MYLTNIKGTIGDVILSNINKREINNESINNIKILNLKIRTFFVDIFTLFPNNIFYYDFKDWKTVIRINPIYLDEIKALNL